MATSFDWRTASQGAWNLACEREAVIRSLVQSGDLTVAQIDEAAAKLGLSRSLIYRLTARYRRRPRTSTLLLRKPGPDRHVRRLEPEREALLDAAIGEFYLSRQRPSVAALEREIDYRRQRHGFRKFNRRTIQRRLDALDPKDVVQARLGAKAAIQLYGPVRGSATADLRPLELVQVDHTLADVIVVDEHQRLPLGRPWLTLAIDVSSRAVAGFYVSLEPPSAVSVALVLARAVLPKETWLADRELELNWPVAGLPTCLQLDNAREFRSHALARGAREHGITLRYRPVGRAHFGGHVERLIGTMMGAVHLLPGTTFSNAQQKGDYRSDKAARLTLRELERWLTLQIAGTYHHSLHSALHTTPLQAWTDGLSRRTQLPRQPDDPQEFFLDLLPGEWRMIRRDGLQLFGIHYWANVLSPLAGRRKKPVLVKYDPRDLSRVYLQDEEGHYWPIPYRELSRPPISLWEQREATRRLRAWGRRGFNEQAIFDTALEQRAIVAEAGAATLRERRRQQRVHAREGSVLDAATSSVIAPAADNKEAGEDYSKLPPFEVEDWST